MGVALFDLDNTLVDRSAAFRRWAAWFVGTSRLDESAVEWLVRADLDGHAPRERVFAELRTRFGLTDGVDDLVRRYDDEYPAFFSPDPDVQGALDALRTAGWRMAIVTNGYATQRTKIARAGLDDWFDACCISGELGTWKPDPRIFTTALAACSVGREAGSDVWMIGDSPEHDMAGARALGLRTVWIHRQRPWPLEDFEPDHRAASVPAAVEIVLAGQRPSDEVGEVGGPGAPAHRSLRPPDAHPGPGAPR